tara:strand:+ start:590 stop:709 length:120 start_codon:yes stop_codon:yes gene_type:complete
VAPIDRESAFDKNREVIRVETMEVRPVDRQDRTIGMDEN